MIKKVAKPEPEEEEEEEAPLSVQKPKSKKSRKHSPPKKVAAPAVLQHGVIILRST